MLRFVHTQRIENMSLWQTFAAKRQALRMRAKAEGRSHDKYERDLLFHGTSNDVITKIMEQVGRASAAW